jgi:S-formylglutathione hydrolase FrmB
MGGYGAFRFAFAYPNMFSAVSAQSAAFMTDTPQQLDAAMRSRMPLTGLLAAVFGDPIQIAHWKANSVFELAHSNRAAIASLAIYFNCGQQDDFGFEAGAAALDKELQSEKIAHEAHLYPGAHDAEYFLGHLAEVMQFHSKNFVLNK